MLKVRAARAVFGAIGVAVRVELHGSAAFVQHRFDCDDHPLFEYDSLPFFSKIGHERLLMHRVADTVSGKVADDAEAVRFNELFDGKTDISGGRTGPHRFEDRKSV